MHVIQTHRRGLHPLRAASAALPPQSEAGEVPRPIKGWTGWLNQALFKPYYNVTTYLLSHLLHFPIFVHHASYNTSPTLFISRQQDISIIMAQPVHTSITMGSGGYPV